MFDEVRVGFAEGFGAEETGCGKGRGVRGFDDEVFVAVYMRALRLGVVAPEDEDESLALLG